MQQNENAQLATIEQGENTLLSRSMVDVSNIDNVPDLKDSKEVPVDLSIEYWDPEKEGDELRAVFAGFTMREATDFQNPEVVVDLECALFIRKEGGQLRRYCNAAKRLVSALKTLPAGTAVRIVFKGKQKNKTNGFESQIFAITPLIINIPVKA